MLRLLLLLTAGLMAAPAMADDHDKPIAIAIHGGAGTITRDQMSPEREQAIRAALEQAARAGHGVLDAGGPALEAVVAAIRVLEDAPEFNAGRGAVLTNTGTVEMDASIMDGSNLDAGSVAAVKGIRHPIEAAVRVMHDSPHVMMIGEGHGLEFMDEEWFMNSRPCPSPATTAWNSWTKSGS